MSTPQQLDLNAIARAGRITDNDVIAMRRAFFHDGTVDTHETLEIFRLGETCQGESDAWPKFLVEALTDYIVYQAEPRGYVSESQAGWLIEHVTRDAHIATHTELELLIKVLETATEVPESLVSFTLQSIKTAVLEGDGKLIGDAQLKPGVIAKPEVDLLRRVLFAASGSGNVGITRTEAELLFDLNDATAEAENDASWSDLFSKAVLNHLMAGNHYQAMSRERALRVNKWLEEPNTGVGGFIGKMFSNEMISVKGFYKAMSDSDWRNERLTRMENANFEAETVTSEEAEWLSNRIGRDGRLLENEKAIVRFIRDECPELHPGLKSLIARV